jgi:membrane protein implicated in regulation of membrane protease activity
VFALYLFSLIVGGGLIAYSLVGGHDSHHGDAGHHDASGHEAVKWFSLRTLTYFLFVFGGVGAALTKTWSALAMPIVFVLAILAGVGVGALVSLAFDYLHRTDYGARASDDSFVGLTAAVTLPIRSGGIGKILVKRGDRSFELMARSLDASAKSAAWKSVVVVEMKGGTAVVAPADDPSVQEIAAINQLQE